MLDDHKDNIDMYHKDACSECVLIHIIAYKIKSDLFLEPQYVNDEIIDIVSYQNNNIIYYIPILTSKIIELKKKSFSKSLNLIPTNYISSKITCCIKNTNKEEKWRIYHDCTGFKFNTDFDLNITSKYECIVVTKKESIRFIIRRCI